MGNLLVAPVTDKETHRGETPDGELQYAVSSMQGWRVHMEDAHICQPSLYAEERIAVANPPPSSSVVGGAALSGAAAGSTEKGGTTPADSSSTTTNTELASNTAVPSSTASVVSTTIKTSLPSPPALSTTAATNTSTTTSTTTSSNASITMSPTNSKREECGGGTNDTEGHVKKAKTIEGTTSCTPNSNTNNTTTATTQYRKIDLPNHSLFAVFDGHGGSFAAQYSGLNFVRVLSRQPSFVKYAHFVQELHARDLMEKEVNGDNVGSSNVNANVNNVNNSTMNGIGNENESGDTVMMNHDTSSSNTSTSTNNNNIGNSPVQQAQIHRKGLELLEQAFRDAFLDLDREIWRVVNHLKNEGSKFPYNTAKNDNYEYNNDLDHDHSYGDDNENSSENNNQSNNDNNDDNDEYNYEYEYSNQDSGTTAVVVLLTPQYIICANAGDSRSVYSKQGHCTIPLSYDHKPDDEEEERRIVDAGGFVRVGRVDGDLAVSRGLGDFRFKEHELYRSMGTAVVEDMPHLSCRSGGEKRSKGRGGSGVGGEEDVLEQNYEGDGDDPQRNSEILPDDQKVNPIPDIIVQKRDRELDEFVVIACDGIFDVQTNHECISLTAEIFQEGEDDMGLVCEEILDLCLEKGSKDNMTALVIKFPAQEVGQGGGVMKRRQLRQQLRQEQAEEEDQAAN